MTSYQHYERRESCIRESSSEAKQASTAQYGHSLIQVTSEVKGNQKGTDCQKPVHLQPAPIIAQL